MPIFDEVADAITAGIPAAEVRAVRQALETMQSRPGQV
jgi:hypothetical protein